MKSLSVVIAAYNCAKWIEETVNDVLSQTYPVLEVIIVDDGSRDETGLVIGKYKDPRVRYIRREKGSGSPAAPRNDGLKIAKGEYITFLDHDDRWYPDRVLQVMEVFEKNPSADIVCHDEYIVSDGKKNGEVIYGPFHENMFLFMMLNGNKVSTSATTMKTETVRRLGGFREGREYFLVEDFDLWLRLAHDGQKYFFLHKFLGEYTVHGENWTRDLEYNYKQEKSYYDSQLDRYPELLEPFRGRILGGLEYGYGRNYHRKGEFSRASEKYIAANNYGYFPAKLMFFLILSVLRIRK